MNFLSLFVAIPLLMMIALFFAKSRKQIQITAVIGSSALLILGGVLAYLYLHERALGNTAEMLFTADTIWYAPFNIHYSVGVDGVSVAMKEKTVLDKIVFICL